MTAVNLAGAEVAARLRAATADAAGELAGHGAAPRLAVVVATDDEASAWYVRSIAKAAGKVGVDCQVIDCGPTASAEAIGQTLSRLAADHRTHGVMLQTPLPAGVVLRDLATFIPPEKDVDGVNPASLGRLASGLPAFAPATAEAVLAVLDHYQVELAGREVVVVGRSTIVGKPVAHLLLDRDATVTICHSRTVDLAAVTGRAEVLVVAAGRAGLITAKHVSPGATVIDVGTNSTVDGGLTGDVEQESVRDRAGALTPVPGGVGPVTTALLLWHTVRAALAIADG
jgi:methylenetetrahydrofolate dehydrogenase (NADP+)/methenyltetrahydrofolate cyclohydrolase